VTAYSDESFLKAAAESLWSQTLVEAMIQNSRKASPEAYKNYFQTATVDGAKFPVPAGFTFQHNDGLQSTHLLSRVQPTEFIVAVKEANGTIHSGQSLESGDWGNHFCPHFAILCARIEEFMLTGKTLYPIEHSLLCTLATQAACQAFTSPGQTIQTPHINMSYTL
jgi:hypothetical protein